MEVQYIEVDDKDIEALALDDVSMLSASFDEFMACNCGLPCQSGCDRCLSCSKQQIIIQGYVQLEHKGDGFE
jgi:hypothetical protein